VNLWHIGGDDWLILPQFSLRPLILSTILMAAIFFLSTGFYFYNGVSYYANVQLHRVDTLIEGINYPTAADQYTWPHGHLVLRRTKYLCCHRNVNIYGDGL
jgi:hypothetical protein